MANLFAAWIDKVESRLAAVHDRVKNAGPAELGTCSLEGGCEATIDAMADYASKKIKESQQFFKVPESVRFTLSGRRLEFASPIRSKSSLNDRVIGDLYLAGSRGRAVVFLGHWNARRSQYARLACSLARLGINCLQLSLPYHDERETPNVGFAREMASENLGLTIRAHRQAIIETRLAIGCLDELGFERIGLVGSSLGSSIATIAAAHDERVRSLSLILMADDFTEVVWTGTATRHIRASLERRFTREEVKKVWSVVSPINYADLLGDRRLPIQIFSGNRDTVFEPERTRRYIAAIESGTRLRWHRFKCGHYSFSRFPFNWMCMLQLHAFLRQEL